MSINQQSQRGSEKTGSNGQQAAEISIANDSQYDNINAIGSH
jgi:hypothetical protein